MTQNLISIVLTDAQIQAVETALTEIETQLVELISLDPVRRRRMKRMGDKSEQFTRLAIGGLIQNPQVVPPSINVPEAQSDLASLDRLRPVVRRLKRLTERAVDTEAALGSDLFDVALKGYKLLDLAGKGQGLESLRKELGERFAKSPRTVDATADDASAS